MIIYNKKFQCAFLTISDAKSYVGILTKNINETFVVRKRNEGINIQKKREDRDGKI